MPRGEPPDPRRPQQRLATTPSGRQVWVDISSDDRLSLIKRLPSRWPEVIMARERGESIEELRDKLHINQPINEHCSGRCDPPCFKDLIADCYSWIETQLHDMAARRARLMV